MFCPNNEKQWGLKQQTRVTFILASNQRKKKKKKKEISPIQYDYNNNNNNNNKNFSFVDKRSNFFLAFT